MFELIYIFANESPSGYINRIMRLETRQDLETTYFLKKVFGMSKKLTNYGITILLQLEKYV